jgi:hypothetical protein
LNLKTREVWGENAINDILVEYFSVLFEEVGLYDMEPI